MVISWKPPVITRDHIADSILLQQGVETGRNEYWVECSHWEFMEDYLEVLRKEFDAEEGTFLLQIRCDLMWDKNAFTRLVTAMWIYCEHDCEDEMIERWVANGFWHLSTFVRTWTTHSNFPQVHSKEYYERSYRRLEDLAYWCFFGESPYIGNARFGEI
jgi:hypothetical protein